MILFETDKKPLTYLLDRIQNRDLALPDFQRSFVWDANATRWNFADWRDEVLDILHTRDEDVKKLREGVRKTGRALSVSSSFNCFL